MKFNLSCPICNNAELQYNRNCSAAVGTRDPEATYTCFNCHWQGTYKEVKKTEELPKVKLEKFLPNPPTVHINKELGNALLPFRENKDHEFDLTLPKVWKTILTEDSEKEIFGDLNPYRQACLPPLPWGIEKYYLTKFAFIEDDQVEIYNERIDVKYGWKEEHVAENRIQKGIVRVDRSGYNTKLKKAISEDRRKVWLPNYLHKFGWIDVPKGWKVKLSGECKRGDRYWSPKDSFSQWENVEDSHSFLYIAVEHVKCCITPDN